MHGVHLGHGKFRLVTFKLVDTACTTEDRGFVSSGVLSAGSMTILKEMTTKIIIIISFHGTHMTRTFPSSR